MMPFHRVTDLEQLLRACYQEFGLWRHPDPGPDPQNLLAPILTRLHQLQDKADAHTAQLDSLAQHLSVLTAAVNANTGTLAAIQNQLASLQVSGGLSDDDKAGLAAGLAQLQKTNAVLLADKAST